MAGRGRAPSEQAAPDGLAPARDGLGLEPPFGDRGVIEIQRARMLSAMVEVTGEHGAGRVTVAHVVTRSGVSRRTFYEVFENCEDCFLAAFDEAVAHASERVSGVYDPHAKWRERINSALTALLELFDDEPGIARLLVVESLGAGQKALERRRRVLVDIVATLDEGAREARASSEPPPLTAEGLVGAVFSVIHGRLLEEKPERLIELAGPLMSMIVLPYLGPVAARRELKRSMPKRTMVSRHPGRDPLRELGIRLTYRTVRVLMAVAAMPGASNQVVASASGIADQGQISKLLARLQRLGLVRNTGAGRARGAPNAWALTGKGLEVVRAMGTDATRRGRQG